MTDVVVRDVSWARKITERLRLQAVNYTDARDKVLSTLIEARDGGAAALLGYASWTAYMAEVFGDAPLRLERDARQELVAELASEGMSTRAIAPIVGTSIAQVKRDVLQGGSFEPPAQTMMRVDPDTGEVEDVPARHVMGTDGKEYAVPLQRKPANRRALTDVAKDAGWDIRKSAERLGRICEDDRFSRNKEELNALLRGHLLYSIETCQGMLDELNGKEDQ